MPRRLGSLPLRSGDTVILNENGRETSAQVTRAQKHKAVATNRDGRLTITLSSEDGETIFRMDVEQHDGEGRVRLDD